jgi:hypothetical protein
MELSAFLARASRTPFAWGVHDCCLWLGDWLVARGHPDPVAAFRGRYSTPLGAHRLAKAHGGVAGIVAAQAEAAGLLRTPCAQAGDVGVVRVVTPQGEEPAGGLCTGPRWAVLGVTGLIVAPMPLLAAWRVA